MPEASISEKTSSARSMSPFCTHPLASVVYVTALGVSPVVLWRGSHHGFTNRTAMQDFVVGGHKQTTSSKLQRQLTAHSHFIHNPPCPVHVSFLDPPVKTSIATPPALLANRDCIEITHAADGMNESAYPLRSVLKDTASGVSLRETIPSTTT